MVEWHAERVVCAATMELKAAQADYSELHKAAPWHDGSFTSWSKDRTASHRYHADWGVSPFVSPTPLDPDDDFPRDANAQPAMWRAAATDEEG